VVEHLEVIKISKYFKYFETYKECMQLDELGVKFFNRYKVGIMAY
jgi:hypothetical protein